MIENDAVTAHRGNASTLSMAEDPQIPTGHTSAGPATNAARATCLQQIRARWSQNGTMLCVGLDPEFERLPLGIQRAQTAVLALEGDRVGAQIEGAFFTFNQAIIDATADLVCAYKPNAAFYEAQGPAGLRALIRTIAYIHGRYPGIAVILDAKRGDIGSTSQAYARAAFEVCEADAITLQPYVGEEALLPFLDRPEKGCFVLCRTSNPGSDEFQGLRVRRDDASKGAAEPLYIHLAQQVARRWNRHGNCALVVGATYPEELRRVRAVVDTLPILVPGVGAQGGDLEATVRAGMDSHGHGLIISVSRSLLYASRGPDFAEAARQEAVRLCQEMNRIRGV